MCTHESWAAGGWERSALLGEAWKSGRNVPEQGAADAAVVQRATVEHQRTDLNFHAAACVEMELTDAPF